MTIRQTAKTALRSRGIEIKRYPDADYHARLVGLLAARSVSTVVDVGANTGGYALALRRAGFRGRLLSFEPQREAFATLADRASKDSSWQAWHMALGSSAGEIELNIAGNSSSSSILPMLGKHREVAPHTAYVGSELVKIERLDRVLPAAGRRDDDTVFLKIDVQGYEGAVLAGATDLLESSALVGVQLEISFTPLYEGALEWTEAFARMTSLGLQLTSFDPVLHDPVSGAILQADVAWLRPVV